MIFCGVERRGRQSAHGNWRRSQKRLLHSVQGNIRIIGAQSPLFLYRDQVLMAGMMSSRRPAREGRQSPVSSTITGDTRSALPITVSQRQWRCDWIEESGLRK